MFGKTRKATVLTLLALLTIGSTLAACGGGASEGCVNLDPSRSSSLPGCAVQTVPTSPPVATASIALALLDANGAVTTSVSPDHPATLLATVKDSKGATVPNTAVTFLTNDKSATFVPSSGTGLTDASGVARVSLRAGTQAGAFTATAGAAVGTASPIGKASYAVTFPTLALGELAIAPATLSAGGNASISVTVMNGASPYTPPLPIEFSSPCIAAGKATIGSPVLTQNGVSTASYTDKGCGVPDIVTASATVSGTTISRSGTINVLPALAGSIKFVSSDTTNIALKSTGGFGRQEFATLTFQVYDTTGSPVAGKPVDFVFANANTQPSIGGLILNPSSATSDANGNVRTIVSNGTIPTSVRVIAKIHGSEITTLSNILVVSTGVPDQKHFSLATEIGNCEGRDVDQKCSIVTATLGDHFGNPAPDGTAVNFSVEGGIIDASCVTGSLPPPGATPVGQTTNSKIGPGSGTCSVLLRASQPRTGNGRVTVLAYAMGEENLVDNNGNNIYDSGDTFSDKSPDIFRDDNEDGSWNPGEPCIGPNNNGLCSSPGDGKYNGVLSSPQITSAQTLYVSNQLVQIFSGSFATISFNTSWFACPAGGIGEVQVTVTDEIGNIMPAGTTISFTAIQGGGNAKVLPDTATVPNIVLGIGEKLIVPTYSLAVACAGGGGKLLVTVTTPLTKTISTASISFGDM